ncbi:helix-turn-helix domain-containing protein [Mesonia aestuariivivens]|uniref:Helix-turn-helix domain-containing protein n=1 Tax=Mesonia aestuariivivens TaxID=2796128 RepID=A0ABS6W5L2_9FLAO|nr:helix-turn-helix transcriptional regulator [Mesonia aestuariivivens]MBW2963141.1 helix-turn-helix domain-containing protein [Mesonia aestuariivivens]
MSFGENVATARKKKKLSQSELAKEVGTIAVTIGRYERNEIKPSIDIATKIADALDVSLDYLVGNTDTALEKDLLKKITDIQKLPEDKKNVVMELLDSFLKQTKLQSIM